jgi:Tetracyclin repressor-like, C-terminal domain
MNENTTTGTTDALDALGGTLGEAGAAALRGARGAMGEGLLRAAFTLWEDPEARPRLLSLLQGAVNSQEGADRMRDYLTNEIFAKAGKAIGKENMDLYEVAQLLDISPININAAVAQVWGVVLLRYIVQLQPIASAPVDDLIGLVSPTIQRYLG